MKFRRHHNNKGLRQIKRGRTTRQVQCMAARLGIPYLSGAERRADTESATAATMTPAVSEPK